MSDYGVWDKSGKTGRLLKVSARQTWFTKACSLVVALTLAVGLCPSVALASPDGETSDKAVVEQPADPSTAPAKQAPETSDPGTSSDNANPSNTPDSQSSTAPNTAVQPAPNAEANGSEQAVEPEAISDTNDEPTADALALAEKTAASPGEATYIYHYFDGEANTDHPYGAGVYITNTTWASSITIPAQIEGKDVVSFYSDAGKDTSYDLDASQATSLVELGAYGLSTLKVSGNNKALKTLYVFEGDLTELDVSKCENLTDLSCFSNHLTHLDVGNNKNLINLACPDNNLVELKVSANAELETLICQNNMLTKLDVSANKKLTKLICFNNRISDPKTLTDRFGTDLEVILPQYSYAKPPRLAGDTALDTMARISERGFGAAETSDTVIVATMGGYWDALTASSLAGLNNCPTLLTDSLTLSSQTESCIKNLKATKVFIAGGPAAVSNDVEKSLKELAGVKTVKRVWGDIAIETALELYKEGKDSWGTTAVVATSATFQDALSISPYAYAKNAPIFLANASTHELDPGTLSAIKSGGFKQVVIVGGPAALSTNIESKQLKGMSYKRLGGATAYETSAAIATWCLTQGMTAANVGVATGSSYYDALTGAALCGKNNSALVLVADDYHAGIDTFIVPNKGSIKEAYVFGGPAAVSDKTYDAIVAALK